MILNYSPREYSNVINLRNEGECFKACLSFCYFVGGEIPSFFHSQEKRYYDGLKFEKRRKDYSLGRYVAKRSVGLFSGEKDLSRIEIKNGVFNQPIVKYGNEQNLQVSISHCEHMGAAVAFQEDHPMGIDIERISSKTAKIIESQIDEDEKELIRNRERTPDFMLILLWTSKESLSKVLKTGLTVPLNLFKINRIIDKGEYFISIYENFNQYHTISFALADYICSITIPKNSEFEMDIQAIRDWFGNGTDTGIAL